MRSQTPQLSWRFPAQIHLILPQVLQRHLPQWHPQQLHQCLPQWYPQQLHQCLPKWHPQQLHQCFLLRLFHSQKALPPHSQWRTHQQCLPLWMNRWPSLFPMQFHLLLYFLLLRGCHYSGFPSHRSFQYWRKLLLRLLLLPVTQLLHPPYFRFRHLRVTGLFSTHPFQDHQLP